MPRVAKELSAIEVKRLTQQGMHAVGGVAGLYLQVTSPNARSWILRTRVADKRRDMGLGSFPEVALADARVKAREHKNTIRNGTDPIAAVKAAKTAIKAERARAIKFADVAEKFIRSHAPSWKNSKHKDQWTNTLATYAYPILGSMVVADIDTPAILRVLQPIWYEKTETATRLRGRIEMVLDAATTQGLREGSNPARWKGHLALALPKPSKITTVTHQKSLPVDAVPSLWSSLTAAEGLGAVALKFLLLTCARSGEVRGAQWSEIDLGTRVWTIPAARMKASKEHRVWLSDAALSILENLPKTSSFVFSSSKGGELSDMTLSAVMRRLQVAAVPHGLRSSFRTWAAERTNHPREVCEQCLAHTTGSEVELAYQRSDLFEKRKQVLKEWARFVTTDIAEGDNLVQTRG